MGLLAVYATEAEVPEPLKEHYKDEKGKWVLDLDGIDDHPKVRGVITANKENVKKRDEAKARVTELEAKLSEIPEDFDAEKWGEMKTQLLDDKDPEKQKKKDEHLQSQRDLYEKRIQNAAKKHAEEKSKLEAQIAELDGYIDVTERDGKLRDSLLEIGVEPELLEGALASLKPSVKVKKMEDGSRKPIVETDLGEVDVPAFVQTWATSKGKAYLGKAKGPGPNGSSNTGTGGKTITRDDFNKLDPVAQMKAMTVDRITVV